MTLVGSVEGVCGVCFSTVKRGNSKTTTAVDGAGGPGLSITWEFKYFSLFRSRIRHTFHFLCPSIVSIVDESVAGRCWALALAIHARVRAQYDFRHSGPPTYGPLEALTCSAVRRKRCGSSLHTPTKSYRRQAMVASFGAPDSEEFPTQKRNAITTQMTDALPTEIDVSGNPLRGPTVLLARRDTLQTANFTIEESDNDRTLYGVPRSSPRIHPLGSCRCAWKSWPRSDTQSNYASKIPRVQKSNSPKVQEPKSPNLLEAPRLTVTEAEKLPTRDVTFPHVPSQT
ncbi:predicted protein [Plenodomus lingam JN3]|uniref:Predicted protein n=1 Tax=Leptosphaeria maculans (strain JN3 / isolate v23.1.3 / race Av1-4-5-6-7-8) TaxID=985895 RepID=E5AEZ4_LEPMJ|nr:predicted protein [Plenodomus lingam JN3]CBY01783.1 predicted protein [Plenodomus lingam JN3]